MSNECPDNPAVIDKILQFSNNIKPAQIETQNGGSDPFITLPGGMTLQSIAHLCPPSRIERNVALQEADSFIGYVNRFKNDNTLIFCNVNDGCAFEAILDYHSAAPELKPAHCKHHALFVASKTPEWLVLTGNDGEAKRQVEFAEFLEENQKLFRSPNGADLLELVRTLHGHKNARFETAMRLDNGSHSCSYEEDIVVKGNNVAKNGAFELPGTIKVGAAVFQGGEVFEITLRLKTRMENRSLVLFYEIANYGDIIRTSTMALVKQVSTATGVIPLLGVA